MMRAFIKSIAVSAWLCSIGGAAAAQTTVAGATLFQDVRIYDGTGKFAVGAVERAGARQPDRAHFPRANCARADRRRAVVIDGGGRTLMPGLIDAHWHTLLVRPRFTELLTVDVGYLNVLGAAEATATLMRGFTTVRDVGGPAFGLKRAIDEGVLPGPRIYPSGAMISVTSGHGDFRASWEVPRTIGAPASRAEQVGAAMIADGPDEVTVRVREQLMQGASQIKLTAGGGVSSPHSPLDVSTFTEAELRAAVEAAGELGHVRDRARLHAGGGPACHCRGRAVHRARAPDGRRDGPHDGGERAFG